MFVKEPPTSLQDNLNPKEKKRPFSDGNDYQNFCAQQVNDFRKDHPQFLLRYLRRPVYLPFSVRDYLEKFLNSDAFMYAASDYLQQQHPALQQQKSSGPLTQSLIELSEFLSSTIKLPNKGQRIGMVLVFPHENRLYLGYSKCFTKMDPFNRIRGWYQALRIAEPLNNFRDPQSITSQHVPFSMENFLRETIKKADIYFKQFNSPSQVVEQSVSTTP